MTSLRIRVSGPGAFALVAGTALAHRLEGGGGHISIAATEGFDPAQIVLLRPEFHRFHAAIGMDTAALAQSGARPVFATDIGSVSLPFTPHGSPRGGAEFHQHWLRSRTLGRTEAIGAFSPSQALDGRSGAVSLATAERLPAEHGIAIAHGAYAELLRARANALGAVLEAAGDERSADLTFECTPTDRAPCWDGAKVALAGAYRVPGMALRSALVGAQRWLSLAARPDESAAEQREFNRLSAAEAERIADMEALLLDDDPSATERPALARKITVFTACGRIPAEDYEVFAPQEWLAALLARGFYPRRHDRLADALPEGELMTWLDRIKQEVASLGDAA